jgi:hypothetical protein
MSRCARLVTIAAMMAVPASGLTAAPAGAKTVSPQKWATAFCTALSAWTDSLNSASSDVKAALSGTTSDPVAAKATLVDFLSHTIDVTDTALQDMKAAGNPDTTNGARINAAIVSALGKAKRVFTKAEGDAESLPTNSTAAFDSSAAAIAAQIQAGGTAIDTALGRVGKLDKDGKLDAVVRKAKACAFLRAS